MGIHLNTRTPLVQYPPLAMLTFPTVVSIHVLLSGLQSHDDPVYSNPDIGEFRHSH